MRFLVLALSLVSSMACSAAYADQPAPRSVAMQAPRTALALAPERLRAPYDVTVIREDGGSLATYARGGRYYVMGEPGERYVIAVRNPTASRIEAVVSVDGLDVIDGEAGDLGKRGYIVPPYGEVRVEGFRTSERDVATFRFAAVASSYAARKGKARNVGVIAVALFEEQAAPEIIEDLPIATDGYRRRRPSGVTRRPFDAGDEGRAAPQSPPSAEATRTMDRSEMKSELPPVGGGMRGEPSGGCCGAAPAPAPPQQRLGLGTEFGEQRYSAVSYTRFVRAPGRPIAIAELRYNDRPGLLALGIPLGPQPDEQEVMLRETADPFPGDRFARPPTR